MTQVMACNIFIVLYIYQLERIKAIIYRLLGINPYVASVCFNAFMVVERIIVCQLSN